MKLKTGSKRKMDDKTLEWLECPICRDLPRSGPLYGCKNGHVLCSDCRTGLPSVICPICRSSDLSCRNLIAEKLLVAIYEDDSLELECRFSSYGCKVKSRGKDIPKHELACWLRTVPCPSNSCTWKGPLKELVKHTLVSKCAQVIKSDLDDFSSVICDFAKDKTVFDMSTSPTFWKPIMFVSPTALPLFVYLVIIRKPEGLWTCLPKTYAHSSVLNSLEVDIRLEPDDEGSSTRTYSFTGKVSPFSTCHEDIIRSGEYLLLSDAQVKTLQREKKLFKYSVKIRKVSGNDTL